MFIDKKITPFLVVAVVVGMMAGNDAWAQARRTSVSCQVQSSGDVKVTYRVSGVGNEDLCVVSSTTFTANCACQNNGGNCPSAENKQTTEVATSTGNIAEPDNGQIRGTQILTAPTDATCEQELTCPGGQDPILASFDTGNVSLQVFDNFNTDGASCSGIGTPIRTGTCTTNDTKELNEECAALFD